MKNVRTSKAVMNMQIEARVTAAIAAEVAAGKRPSDMGRKEHQAIAKKVYAQSTPEEIKAVAMDGLRIMACRYLGSKIAEVVWQEGLGAGISDIQVKEIGKRVRIAPDDILECWQIWQESYPDFTAEEAADFEPTKRFAPLFLGEPEAATLGEIATKKAARGDKLALSFLAWKEIA